LYRGGGDQRRLDLSPGGGSADAQHHRAQAESKKASSCRAPWSTTLSGRGGARTPRPQRQLPRGRAERARRCLRDGRTPPRRDSLGELQDPLRLHGSQPYTSPTCTAAPIQVSAQSPALPSQRRSPAQHPNMERVHDPSDPLVHGPPRTGPPPLLGDIG